MLAANFRGYPLCSGIFLACLLWRLDSNFSGIVLGLSGLPRWDVFRHIATVYQTGPRCVLES